MSHQFCVERILSDLAEEKYDVDGSRNYCHVRKSILPRSVEGVN